MLKQFSALQRYAGRESACGKANRENACGKASRESACGKAGRESACGKAGRENACGKANRESAGKCRLNLMLQRAEEAFYLLYMFGKLFIRSKQRVQTSGCLCRLHISSSSISSAFMTEAALTSSRDPQKRLRRTTVPSLSATAIYTRPTGFSSLPPVGPAIPVIAADIVAPGSLRAPRAICSAHCSLTAPKEDRMLSCTPRQAFFISFE